MQHRFVFEAVDRTLRDIRGSDALFGGIPVILGGDFAQILPVVRRGDRPQIVQACLQYSPIWPQLEVRKLTENMRVQGADPENRAFVQWLQDLSYNPAFHGSVEPLASFGRCYSQGQLIQRVYPRSLLEAAASDSTLFADRAILCPRNITVADINAAVLAQCPGETTRYFSTNSVDQPPAEEGLELPPISPEFLFSLNFSGLQPSILELKVGVPVILLRNLQASKGMCNGTRLVITRLGRWVLQGKVLSGSFAGEIRLIPRIKLQSSKEDFAYIITRTQFPVRLCFAMSINKSQGQSFRSIGVDLRDPVFSHGQFYVAMSRATEVRNISICYPGPGLQSSRVANIVYPEVLIH